MKRMPPGFSRARTSAKNARGVADLVEHVGENANVVAVGGVVGEGNVADLAVDDFRVITEPRAGGVAGGRGQVHAGENPSAPGRPLHEMPGATADFEQPSASRGAVAVEEIEGLIGGVGAEAVGVGVDVGEEIGLAGELGEFVGRGLRVGEHQLAIVTPHDAKPLHGELVRQAAAVAHRAR